MTIVLAAVVDVLLVAAMPLLRGLAVWLLYRAEGAESM